MFLANITKYESYHISKDTHDEGIVLMSIFFGIIFLILLTLCINYNCCRKKRMGYEEPLL